jgi:hypothetical protein
MPRLPSQWVLHHAVSNCLEVRQGCGCPWRSASTCQGRYEFARGSAAPPRSRRPYGDDAGKKSAGPESLPLSEQTLRHRLHKIRNVGQHRPRPRNVTGSPHAGGSSEISAAPEVEPSLKLRVRICRICRVVVRGVEKSEMWHYSAFPTTPCLRYATAHPWQAYAVKVLPKDIYGGFRRTAAIVYVVGLHFAIGCRQAKR